MLRYIFKQNTSFIKASITQGENKRKNKSKKRIQIGITFARLVISHNISFNHNESKIKDGRFIWTIFWD
jgi:hypothetical protein